MNPEHFNLAVLVLAVAAYWIHWHSSFEQRAMYSYKHKKHLADIAAMPMHLRVAYFIIAPVGVPLAAIIHLLRGIAP